MPLPIIVTQTSPLTANAGLTENVNIGTTPVDNGPIQNPAGPPGFATANGTPNGTPAGSTTTPSSIAPYLLVAAGIYFLWRTL
jgi:hypothetical protein